MVFVIQNRSRSWFWRNRTGSIWRNRTGSIWRNRTGRIIGSCWVRSHCSCYTCYIYTIVWYYTRITATWKFGSYFILALFYDSIWRDEGKVPFWIAVSTSTILRGIMIRIDAIHLNWDAAARSCCRCCVI